MAENKKSIIVYAEWLEQFEYLTDEEAGKLIKHFFRYVNDLNPIAPDRFIEAQFIPIKQTLKRDLDKWEKTINERSVNGRLGNLKKYNIDLYNNVQSNLLSIEDAEQIAKNRKASQPDSVATKSIAKLAVNDNVNVNVNDNVNNIKEKTALPTFSFYHSLIKIGGNENLVSDWLKVRKNKRATNTETAFKKFTTQVEKSGYNINEVLEKCIEKSWSGFDADWFKKGVIKTNIVDGKEFSPNFQHPSKRIPI